MHNVKLVDRYRRDGGHWTIDPADTAGLDHVKRELADARVQEPDADWHPRNTRHCPRLAPLGGTMKVRTAFVFDERTLRTIRAAHGRGGVASRKECLTFIDRAVQDALGKAPAPKAIRVKRPPVVAPPVQAEPLSEAEQATANRLKIRRMYHVGKKEVPHVG